MTLQVDICQAVDQLAFISTEIAVVRAIRHGNVRHNADEKLMNHQSLFDIPLVVQSVVRGYPRIVTRQRYSRSIPLISHMVKLYQYPVVAPSANRLHW